MDIEEAQKMLDEIYGERDRKSGAERTFMWLTEEVGELSRAIMREGNIEEEMADILAWLLSLANILDVDLESAFKAKYPGYCPRCGKKPCQCPEV